MGDDWDDSIQSKEQIEANLLSKHEAAVRRERALAYAYSHQVTGFIFCLLSHSSLAISAVSYSEFPFLWEIMH